MTTTYVAGRERNYRDPVELDLNGEVNLDDPLERAAIAAHRMTFATPEDVASDFGRAQGRLMDTWLALEPATRQLWRRRADVTIRAHNGKGGKV